MRKEVHQQSSGRGTAYLSIQGARVTAMPCFYDFTDRLPSRLSLIPSSGWTISVCHGRSARRFLLI